MKLPCVRFVRCFDVTQLRMLNLWMLVRTEEELRDAPLGMELCVTAQTVESAIEEIRKINAGLPVKFCLCDEMLSDIERASIAVVEQQKSIYASLVDGELKHASIS